MVTPESLEPGAARKMTGSVIIFEAENIEEAKKIVHSDAYYTGRVVSGFAVLSLHVVTS